MTGQERPTLAVDIGGTKLAVGLVDSDATVLFRTYAPTPSTSGPDEAETIYRVLDELVRQAFDHAERTPESGGRPVLCGVGCGGPMAPKGLHVSPLNILGWREFPLGQRLAADHDLEVHIDNDAKALALAEWWAGAAQGLDHFVAMVVSTGVGGGVVLDGELLDGRLGNAGHIGHMIVEPDGGVCGCGAQGCLEAEISGLALGRRLGDHPSTASDEERRRAGRLLGRGLASVANLLDIDRFLVGGSVALGFGAPFFDAAQQELSARARLDFSRPAQVGPVGLDADAPLIGAAAVGLRATDRLTLGGTR